MPAVRRFPWRIIPASEMTRIFSDRSDRRLPGDKIMKTSLSHFSRLFAALIVIAGAISCSSGKMAMEAGLKSSVAESDFPSLYTPKSPHAKPDDFTLSISFADSTVTLNCHNAPLRKILDAFVDKAGMSIIARPQLNERVSIVLKDRGTRDALDTILDLNDYELTELPNGVSTIGIKSGGGPISKEYRFDYLAASSVVDAIANMTGQGSDLGFTPIVERNSILVSGDAQEVEQYIRTLRNLDAPAPSILLEVVIVEFDMMKFESYGFNFSSIAKHRLQIKYAPADFHSIGKQLAGSEESLPGDLSNNTFFANLEALVQDNTATIISHPHIIATSGKAATFSVSEDRYFKAQGFDFGEGGNELEKMSADIHLTMTPYLTGNGEIIIDLDMGAHSFVTPPADQDQVVQGNNLTSFLRVRDNDVLVAGGIVAKSSTRQNGGFPFLRKIPLINLVFSETENSKSRNEVVCFIIPHIYDHTYQGENQEVTGETSR